MAKTSQVNRNAKRMRMSARDKAKRSALKAIVKDRELPVEDRAVAAQRLADPHSPALRAHRPLAGELPQVPLEPHCAA